MHPSTRRVRLAALAAGLLALLGVAAPLTAQPVHLVLHDGVVVTMDEANPEATAIAIAGERIVAVGDDEAVLRLVEPGTRVIDLDGRFVMPGFIESHGHFVGLGRSRMILDLTTARTWQDVVEQVAAAAAEAAPGTWITGRGWHQEKWQRTPDGAVEGFPRHDELSAAAPDHPVVLTHASGHACIANAAAMAAGGISGSTPDPPGGEIIRDDRGEPIGVFRETAQALVSPPAETGRRGRLEALRAMERAIELASAECTAKGVTGFHDAGSDLPTIEALAEAAEDGRLGVRLWVMIRDRDRRIEQEAPDLIERCRPIPVLTVGGIKVSLDGALGPRGAWLLGPYTDQPDSTGLNLVTLESLRSTAELAKAMGLQLCVHAIGDRANREVLDLYEQVLDDPVDRAARRWRIEHAQHLHPDDVPRFAELGVIAAMQGIHCTSDGPWVLQRLGTGRARSGAYVWRDLLDHGTIIANGTDAPVEDVDPLASFHASVTRRMASGETFFPAQRMTRTEALRSYTIDAARAAFQEHLTGSLTPGKYADVVVLSENLLTCPDEAITGASVELTIVGGAIAHEWADGGRADAH